MTKNDPALVTVRKVRKAISRELGNDPARLIAHYTELQARYKGPLIRGPEVEADDPKKASPEAAQPVR